MKSVRQRTSSDKGAFGPDLDPKRQVSEASESVCKVHAPNSRRIGNATLFFGVKLGTTLPLYAKAVNY